MKKFLILTAAAVAVFAFCAKTIDHTRNTGQGDSVSFGVYIPKTITKGGIGGELTTTTLQTKGFGVFAYYTGANAYDVAGQGDAINFMYNQKVSGASWTYTPVKYWPNMTNGDSDTPASSDDNAPMLSFLAYAPYAQVTPSTGVSNPATGETANDVGITAVSKNTDTGDALVTYTVPNAFDPLTSVDLTYAVGKDITYTDVAGNSVAITDGDPVLNLTKPDATNPTKIKFLFKHALALLDVQTQLSVDQTTLGGTFNTAETKVTVEEIKITIPGQYNSGKLNLRTGVWDFTGATSANKVITISGDNINAAIKDDNTKTFDDQPDGVVAASLTPAFVQTPAPGAITILPKTGSATTLTVEITYYVITKDGNLDAGESRIKNHITKDVEFPNTAFDQGTKNILKIGLGLTSVKLEAEVANWDDGEEETVFLPINS